jgi:predicted dehydrogenase
VHVPALRRVAGVEVAALGGQTRERAEAVARELGIPVACGSIDELLELGLDAVTIAVPPERQAAAAAAALEAGLPVLAEKPLAVSVAEAEDLAARAAGRTAVVDFEFAELATFRTLRETLSARTYGDVREVSVVWLTRPRAPRPPGSWKADAARGGGVLALYGSHVLYLLEWLFGPLDGLGSDSSTNGLSLSGRVGDAVPVTVRLDDASPVQRHEWRVVCDDATLIASNTELDAVRGFRLVADPGTVLAEEPADPHADGRVAPVAAVMARFLGAAAAGKPAAPDFAAGLRVQRLMADVGEVAVR